MRIPVRKRAGVRIGQEDAGRLVRHDLVAAPGVEELMCRLQECLCPLVALVLRQESAAAKVLSGEGIPRGHDIPGGTATGEMVQRGELPGHLVGLIEGRVDRAGQPESLGDCRQCGQHGEGVGTANHIEVVDLAVLLAKPQPFGEEQEVELAPLGRLSKSRKRAELDMAASRRLAPHGGVVDARKVRGQVNLLDRLAHVENPRCRVGQAIA